MVDNKTIEKIVKIKEEINNERKSYPHISTFNKRKSVAEINIIEKKRLLTAASDLLRDAAIAIDSYLSIGILPVE